MLGGDAEDRQTFGDVCFGPVGQLRCGARLKLDEAV